MKDDARFEAEIRELSEFRRSHPNLFKHTGGFETHDDFLLRLLDAARRERDELFLQSIPGAGTPP